MVYRAPENRDEGDVHTGTRVCRDCKTRKPMNEFHWTASRKHRSRRCKQCCHVHQAERRDELKRAGLLPVKVDRLRREYGLTPEEVTAMRETQGDACAICKQPFGERLHIDHCHETGHVRALLCHNCNLGLGHFRDDPALILKAAAYVTGHRERTAGLPAPKGRHLTPAERQDRRRAAALRQHRSGEGRAALERRSAAFRGEEGNSTRLQESDVREIRDAYARGGVSLRRLAEKYGVTPSHVGYIVKRKVWAHVP